MSVIKSHSPASEVGAESVPEPAWRSAGLTRAAIGGTVWLSLARWVIRASHIVTIVLLARVLTPVEYGMVALAKMYSNFMFLGTTGLRSAAIQQKQEADSRTLDTAWTYDAIVFKLLTAVLFFATAPLVAGFFREPALTPMIQVMAVIPLVQAFENNAQVVLSRRLEYRSRSLLEGSTGLATLVAAVPLVLWLRDAWAFVLAYVFGWVARTVVSYVIYPHIPRPNFHGATFRRLFRFGRWMFVLRFVNIAREQLSSIVLGRVLGATTLGYFQIGSRVSSQLTTDMNQISKRVLFPIYAKVQEDHAAAGRGHARTVELSLLVVAPVAVAVGVVAYPLVVTVFGAAWAPAVPIVQLLCAAGVLKAMSSLAYPLFRGLGRPQLEAACDAFYVVLLLPLVVWLTSSHGYVGTCIAVLVAEVVQLVVVSAVLRIAFGVSPLSTLRAFAGPAFVAVWAGSSAWAALLVVRGQSDLVQLLVAGSAAALAYFIGLAVGSRLFGMPGVRAVLQVIRGGRKRASAVNAGADHGR